MNRWGLGLDLAAFCVWKGNKSDRRFSTQGLPPDLCKSTLIPSNWFSLKMATATFTEIFHVSTVLNSEKRCKALHSVMFEHFWFWLPLLFRPKIVYIRTIPRVPPRLVEHVPTSLTWSHLSSWSWGEPPHSAPCHVDEVNKKSALSLPCPTHTQSRSFRQQGQVWFVTG